VAYTNSCYNYNCNCKTANSHNTVIHKVIREYCLCCAVAVPMSPADLSVTSVTWESVELTWTPGNDGGRHQVFVVTFIANTESPDMEHIPAELTTNSSTYNVTGIIMFCYFYSISVPPAKKPTSIIVVMLFCSILYILGE